MKKFIKRLLHTTLPSWAFSGFRRLRRSVRALRKDIRQRVDREKVRLRTEKELQVRFAGMKLAADILNEYGFTWHVSGGTALGVARDGDFIPWDWDVGFGLKQEEVFDKRHDLVETFTSRGFSLIKLNDDPLQATITFDYHGEEFELIMWTLEGDMRRRRDQVRPDRFYDSLEYRELRGATFPFPSPLHDYLAYLYGDWQTPKRTAHKKTYRAARTWVK